jgi:hypothetical protein
MNNRINMSCISRCISKAIYLEKPERFTICNGGSNNISFRSDGVKKNTQASRASNIVPRVQKQVKAAIQEPCVQPEQTPGTK